METSAVTSIDCRSILRCVFAVAACYAVLRAVLPIFRDLGLGVSGKPDKFIVEPNSQVKSGNVVAAAAASVVRVADGFRKGIVETLTPLGIEDICLNPFAVYAFFLGLVFVVGEFTRLNLERRGFVVLAQHWIWFFSASAEGLGLVFLRFRIHKAKRVAGISCKAMCLYALMYAWRASVFPEANAASMYAWSLKTVELVSMCLVFDVIRSIVFTYRDTYQEELDIVHVKHVVGVCFLLTMLFNPQRGDGTPCSHAFTMQIYVDTFALLPQVVFMARQDCPVPAPIAHFVVATSISRLMDLFYWTEEYGLWADTVNVMFSGWVVMGLHCCNLLISADFLYYWAKARMAGRGFDEDTPLPSAYDP